MCDDIFDYSDNLLYWKNLIDDVLINIGEPNLETNKSVIFSPEEYAIYNSNSFASFRFKNKESIDIVIVIIDDILRIDIEGLFEFREYFIDDIKNNENILKEELILLFTSEVRVEYYCEDYIKIILFNSRFNKVKEYRYYRGFLLPFYYWLYEPRKKIYNSLF